MTTPTEDMLQRLHDTAHAVSDLMYARISAAPDEALAEEMVAQAAAAYSWFLLIVDSLPSDGRVMAMQIGSNIARSSNDVSKTYQERVGALPKA
jgi:hypothetical protein